MFKVADKMASVCLWVAGPGAFQNGKTARWNVRTTPRTTEPQQNFATQNVTHIHTCIHHIHRFAKKSMENGYAIYFFLQSKK